MFDLLGWDMANRQGLSDVYKDVLCERAITSVAPVLSFRSGGVRKFFLEARGPLANVATSSESAAYLRSYRLVRQALSLSVLTDFASFAVYDGRIPIPRSGAPRVSEARVMLVPCARVSHPVA